MKPPPRSETHTGVVECWRGGAIAPVIRTALRHTIPKGRVLDLGSATGRHALYLSERGYHVTAVDRNIHALRALNGLARERHLTIETVQADIVTYRPPHNYDLVIAANVLHFIPRMMIRPVIDMMKDHTTIHGVNALVVHTRANEWSGDRYLFAKNELRGYYCDWEVLEYKELWGLPFQAERGGRIVRRHRAELVARPRGVRGRQ